MASRTRKTGLINRLVTAPGDRGHSLCSNATLPRIRVQDSRNGDGENNGSNVVSHETPCRRDGEDWPDPLSGRTRVAEARRCWPTNDHHLFVSIPPRRHAWPQRPPPDDPPTCYTAPDACDNDDDEPEAGADDACALPLAAGRASPAAREAERGRRREVT